MLGPRAVRMRSLALIVALALASCGGGDAVGDVSSDTAADAAEDTQIDPAVDGPPDSADTATDTHADGTAGGGPILLYSGPRDAGAVVPGWNPDSPRPLVVYAKYSTGPVWYVSMAEVSPEGVVGGMVTDVVRFWGWDDLSPDAPSILYEGRLDSGAVIPGWNASAPFPIIALTRYSGTQTWYVSMLEVAADGLVSGPVTDEIVVWGWTSGAAPGCPEVLYDGPLGSSAVVPGWSVADPRPLVVLAGSSTATSWWLSMAEVSEVGVLGGMITDRVRFSGW